jgi:hypothetical protein
MVHNLRSEFDPHRHLRTEPGKSEKIIYTYLFTARRPKGFTWFFLYYEYCKDRDDKDIAPL